MENTVFIVVAARRQFHRKRPIHDWNIDLAWFLVPSNQCIRHATQCLTSANQFCICWQLMHSLCLPHLLRNLLNFIGFRVFFAENGIVHHLNENWILYKLLIMMISLQTHQATHGAPTSTLKCIQFCRQIVSNGSGLS